MFFLFFQAIKTNQICILTIMLFLFSLKDTQYYKFTCNYIVFVFQNKSSATKHRKMYSVGFYRSNPFSLSLSNICSFIFSDKAENLENNIRKKSTHQIFTSSCVQQRHIKNNNINAFLFSQNPPLI